MHGSNREVENLLTVISKTVRKYGIKKLRSILTQLYYKSESETQNIIINQILYLCGLKFAVAVEDILYSSKRGDIAEARKMCYVLLNHHASLSQYSIADYFNKSRQLVGQSIKSFKEAPVTRKDLEFLKKYEELSLQIQEMKNALQDG